MPEPFYAEPEQSFLKNKLYISVPKEVRKGVFMNKKFVIMAILLSAFCFTGFAQEVLNSEAPRYIAKASEEKEYTFIVFGKVFINGQWVEKREKFVIISKSQNEAEDSAHAKFKIMYSNTAGDNIRRVVITCESIKDNACQL